jgi:hypothetical protein
MCLGRAPSVTRKRDRKVKGMEGRVETDKALLSSYYGLGISPWSICTLFGIVGFFGFRSWDWRRNVWAQEGRAWRKTRALDHWEGGASLSPHLTFSWNPSSRVRQTPCLKIPIALVMFSQKRNRGFAVKGPALQRCERGQWGLEFLPLGT